LIVLSRRRAASFGLLAATFLVACSEPPIDPDALGEPIVAEPGEWTWVDFPYTYCGDGSPSGLVVNPSPAEEPTGLFIYLEGGGACWTQETCSASDSGFGLALHFGGYDEGTWEGLWGSVYRTVAVFDRERADNPWRNAHMVFVPYCTGDVFAGDAITELTSEDGEDTETFYFKGHHNFRQYLKRLVPTFGDVSRVWLTGSSAGAFGASMNWFQTAEMFEGVRVDVLADSGQPIDPAEGLYETWLDTWNLQVPDGCPDCDQGVGNIIEYALDTRLAEGSRYGLIAFPRDPIISDFMELTEEEHEAKVEALFDGYFNDPDRPEELRERARYFAIGTAFHTTLIYGYSQFETDGVELGDWLMDFVNDEPGWSNVDIP
jgi:hypothetical protein